MKKSLLLIVCLLISLPLTLAETPGEFNDTLERFDKSLAKEIPLPENLEKVARIALGIRQSNPLTLSLFVLVCALWLVVVLVTANILELSSLFDKTSRWIGAIAIVTIGAAGGIFETLAITILAFGEKLTFFAEWSSGALALALILLIGIIVLVQYLLKPLKEHQLKIREQNKGFIEGVKEARRRIKEETAEKLVPLPKDPVE